MSNVSPSTRMTPEVATSRPTRWRRIIDFPEWMGPSTTPAPPRWTSISMSEITGSPIGPVSDRTSSTGSDKSRDEVEEDVDDRVDAEDGDHAEHHRPSRRRTNRMNATLDTQSL